MKTKKTRSTRSSASIHRITRGTAVKDRQRRLSLWQFYLTRPDEAPRPTTPIKLTTEASAR